MGSILAVDSQPGCAPRSSTCRPAGDETSRWKCGSGDAAKRSGASTASRSRPAASTIRQSRTRWSCARRWPYLLAFVLHHC